MSFSEMLNYKIQLFKPAEFEMDLEWKSRFEKKQKLLRETITDLRFCRKQANND